MKGWIITKDYCTSENAFSGLIINDSMNFKEVEIIGPRGCTLSKDTLLSGNIFRMFDDDDNLMLEGYLFGDHKSTDGFLPLDNYGTPSHGCTLIKYKTTKGEWTIL